MARPRLDIRERLERRLQTDPETGCRNWTGPVGHNGYGSLGAGGRHRLIRAHRAAYELANGPIPPGLEIDHLCRNRRCCNPDHLEAVTREENIARGNAPHAINARKTHCKRGHEFTAENTRLGRPGERVCRECVRQYRIAHAPKAAAMRKARGAK